MDLPSKTVLENFFQETAELEHQVASSQALVEDTLAQAREVAASLNGSLVDLLNLHCREVRKAHAEYPECFLNGRIYALLVGRLQYRKADRRFGSHSEELVIFEDANHDGQSFYLLAPPLSNATRGKLLYPDGRTTSYDGVLPDAELVDFVTYLPEIVSQMQRTIRKECEKRTRVHRQVQQAEAQVQEALLDS